MKYRESGMPSEDQWKTYFSPEELLKYMDIDQNTELVIDIGCGYGNFLIPLARIVNNVVGIDIDPDMIKCCKSKIDDVKLQNIKLLNIDISEKQQIKLLEKYRNQADYITLFNILHCENPDVLLKTAIDLLKSTGKIGVIHWKYESTPRGPSMEIRPTPEKIIKWAKDSGLKLTKKTDLKPYHYGLVFNKS